MGDFGIIFLIFVVLNTVLSFKAGAHSARWTSMVSVFYFLKSHDCLKDANHINDFNKWPDLLKQAYTDPEKLIK
jgi:hypothetical protein